MRGKCMLFLFLLFLTLGGLSSAGAQDIDVWVESDTSGRLFEGCAMELTIQMQDITRTNLQRSVIIKCTGAAKYTTLPEAVALINGKITIPFTVAKMPESIDDTDGTITVSLENQPDLKKDMTYVFYNTPVYKVIYTKPTTMFSGKLELNIEGGSPYMLRQWKSGGSPVDARSSFSQSEIANSSAGDILLLWEPNSCWEAEISLVSAGGGSTDPGSPTIKRPVTIPMLTNAETVPAAGLYSVVSNSDFPFVIKPHVGNKGHLIVTTDRNIPDEEGVKIESKEDGSYSVTILSVQTATNINIRFEDVNGNKWMTAQKVWADNDILYISSIVGGQAKVYNMTGQLAEIITCSAGETIGTALSKGFYVVIVNNQTYKVHIR